MTQSRWHTRMIPRQHRKTSRPGVTRTEVAVVLLVVGLTGAMLCPAVLTGRELARKHSSVDNLHQIGEGLFGHVDTYGFLPGNGGPAAESVTTPLAQTINPNDAPYRWGYGDPRRAGRMQPGCWAFAILPYIGHEEAFTRRNQAVAPECYYIPGRRAAVPEQTLEVDPIYEGWGCLPDGVNPWGKTDYACNDRIIRGGVGRVTRLDELEEGLSTSILIGEKAMDSRAAGQGGWYWDEPIILGGSGGTGRKGDRLLRDGPIHEDAADNWGSPDATGVSFLFADGAVRTFSYRIDQGVMKALIAIRKTTPLPDKWWEKEGPNGDSQSRAARP